MDFSTAIGKVQSTEAYSETKPAANQPKTGRQDRREGVKGLPSTERSLQLGRQSGGGARAEARPSKKAKSLKLCISYVSIRHKDNEK